MTDFTEETALRSKWMKRLSREEEAHKEFREQAKTAQEAYLGEKNKSYPLFWPTIKVLHARIYSQPPKPDVRKRYQDDPGQKPAMGQPGQQEQQQAGANDNRMAQCIERALTYTIDTTDFDADGHAAVDDMLVAGLGIAKVELETKTQQVPVINPMTQQPIMDGEGKPITKEVIADQYVKLRMFSWKQFRWEPQQHWSQVTWVSFDHWMTEDEIEDEFDIDLSEASAGKGKGVGDKPDANKYKPLFCVHEIWDKTSRKILFLTESYNDILDKREDSLGLEDFFPCPKPMMTNVKGDDMVPRPDYSYCEVQFKGINELSMRIDSLSQQIKDIGFYDASVPELAQLPTLSDGSLIPISGLAARFEAIGAGNRGGYDAVVCKQNNAVKAEVVQQLLAMRAELKQTIWETYGISDIQRGSTIASETATAQQIKAQWADIRVGERVRIVSLFFRDVFRLMAEIIAEHFQPEILHQMTGVQLSPEDMDVLRSDLGRCYAIDVESDSTVVQDETAEKQNRMEFLQTVTGFVEKILPAVQQNAIPADLAKELILFAVNTFKSGRQLEDTVNALPGSMQQLQGLGQQLQQAAQQTQQLQQQNQQLQGELQKVNAGKEQRENVKTATDAQKTNADTQKTEVETAKLAQEIHGNAQQPLAA